MNLLALIIAALALGAAGSSAAPDAGNNVIARSGAWYTNPATMTLGTTTIASGDFPVGRGPHGEDKRSYVQFELPANAQTAKIELRLSSAPATTIGIAGTIRACAATAAWFPGAGVDLAAAPTIDCSKPVVGTASGGKLLFDITPIVQRWAVGIPNHGVAFVAHTDQPLPWQTTFNLTLDEVVGTATSSAPPPPVARAREFEVDPVGFPSAPIAAPLPAIDLPPLTVSPSELAVEPSAARTPAETGPLAALPVNLAVWLLVPVAFGVLYACARALGSGGEPRSSLDRVLPS